jgi:predicted amino acid dehydrogenase
MNGKIHFSFIALAVDSAELDKRIRQRKQEKIIEKIQDAVDLAQKLGVKTVSLGAYTSIISNNGLSLVESGDTRIITGNTLTAASGIIRLKNAINNRSNALEPIVLGIVGASGNIGSILTQSFVESELEIDTMYLFGRSSKKLQESFSEIQKGKIKEKHTIIKTEEDLGRLRKCNVIIVATNTNDPIIFPHHIHPNAEVIISDLSIPRAVSEEVYEMGNVVPLNFASYIKLPEESELVISSHTPKGTVFCCAAEAILNGLHPIDCKLKGRITIEGVRKVMELGEEYHFFDQVTEAATSNIL